MKPFEQRSGLFMIVALVVLAGCSGNMAETQTKRTDFVQRDLRPSDRAERKTLYEQLLADLRREESKSPYWTERLKGKKASEFQPFLDLADESGRVGDKMYYNYVFRTESEFDPKRFQEGDAWITIVVENEVITNVSYDVMVR